MAILKQKGLDEIKGKYKHQIDSALKELERISLRVEQIRDNDQGINKLGAALQQNELAYLLDIQPQNYSRMRKGKKNGGMDIALHHLVKIAIYTGASLDYLILGKEESAQDLNKNIVNNNISLAEERLRTTNALYKTISLLEEQYEYMKKERDDLKQKLDDYLN